MKNYTAILLAAGYSSRMGSFKPLMDLCGKTPLQRCIALFQSCGINDIILVAGYQSSLIQDETKTCPIRIIINEEFRKGMYSSIKAGIKAISYPTDAFFLLPVDIPSIKAHSIKKMIEHYENFPDGILLPTFQEEMGHPALISYSLAKEILEKDPEGGLRDILKQHKEEWHYEQLVDRGILLDMDTKEDFYTLYQHVLDAPYPDYEECMEMLRLVHVRQDTIAHMKSVGEFSKKIASLLKEKGFAIHLSAVYAGALLHDIAKGHKQHEEKGADIVESYGYPCLREIISEHTMLKTSCNIAEKEIVYLCDKLIKGNKLVTLEKRFEEAFQKHENEPHILENVNLRYAEAKKIKNKIENVLGNSLENLYLQNGDLS